VDNFPIEANWSGWRNIGGSSAEDRAVSLRMWD
jgi:hypothetical protein